MALPFTVSAFVCLAQTAEGDLEAQLTGLVNAGAYQEARDRLGTVPHDAVDSLLLEGRILKSQGNATAAIAPLRQALQAAPQDLRIRRELAHTLYITGQMRAAKYHLNVLLQRDPDPILRQSYRAFLSRIDRERPLTFAGYFEFKPSTNVNSGSSEKYFHEAVFLGQVGQIDEDDQAQSGIGVGLGGTAIYRKQLEQGRRLEFRLGADHTRYSKNHDLDRTLGRLEVRHIVLGQRKETLVAPFVHRSWTHDDNDVRTLGLRFQQFFALTAKNRWSYWISQSHQLHLHSEGNTGWRSSLGGRYTRQSTPTLSWGVSIGADVSRPDIEFNRFKGLTLTGNVAKDWQGGTITYASFFTGYRDFQGKAPLVDFPRFDDFWGASISVQPTQFSVFGLSPVVTCDYMKNQSNLSLYTFDRKSCGVRLTRDF